MSLRSDRFLNNKDETLLSLDANNSLTLAYGAHC